MKTTKLIFVFTVENKIKPVEIKAWSMEAAKKQLHSTKFNFLEMKMAS